MKPLPKWLQTEILRQVAAGMLKKELARLHNIAYYRVTNLCTKHGIKSSYRESRTRRLQIRETWMLTEEQAANDLRYAKPQSGSACKLFPASLYHILKQNHILKININKTDE